MNRPHSSGISKSVGLGRSPTKGPARFRKLQKENIMGITKPSLRRLARRAGIKRISSQIYDTMRQVLMDRLRTILHQIAMIIKGSGPEGRGRKTVRTSDVIFVLKRLGTPIYGWDRVYTVGPNGKRIELQWKY